MKALICHFIKVSRVEKIYSPLSKKNNYKKGRVEGKKHLFVSEKIAFKILSN